MLRKKFPVTRPGIDSGTFRLVAQRLNHYATPGPIQWVPDLFPGGKAAGRGLDHPNLAPRVKKENRYTSTPPLPPSRLGLFTFANGITYVSMRAIVSFRFKSASAYKQRVDL
jgi:hypothetical protein